ncbi:MAG: hypothetical protein SOV58_05095 [Candidatus Enteromonas sp.]|nr:hypothetical protein [Candidatus Enteromonas sp.]
MEENKIVIRDSGRTARRRQRKTLGSSVVAYLVELITNSDDSYKRLESAGVLPKEQVKPIYVEYWEKKGNYYLSVTDNAEGMDSQRVRDIFEHYGGDNAGGDSSASRGIFGQGATDVMINAAMGGKSAKLESFKNGIFCKFHFGWDEAKGERTLEEKPVDIHSSQLSKMRANYRIPENGTKMTFGIPTDSVKFKKETLVDEIIGAYSLRFILAAANRQIIFINGISELVLSSNAYSLKEENLLERKQFTMNFEGTALNCELSLFRNPDKPAQGEFATDILVTDSNQVVFANTMFHFEKNPRSKDISGILKIDGLYQLCKAHLNQENPDEIINDDRTGFNEKHDFYKALTKHYLDKIIMSCFAEHGAPTQEVDISKNKKFKSALDAVNKWMNEEQKREISGGGSPGVTPPKDGLDFGKSKIEITAGATYSLTLIINSEQITPRDDIFIDVTENENEYVEVSPDVIAYNESEIDRGIVRKSITIKGLKPCENDDIVFITASSLTFSKTIMVRVVDVDIIYPENGLAFEFKEATFTPEGNHKSPIWFDTDYLTIGSKIKLSSDGLTILSEEITLDEGMLVTDHIGKFNAVVSGGVLGNKYTLTAEIEGGAISTSQTIEIKNQPRDPKGTKGMFSSIRLTADEDGAWQVTFDSRSGTLYINSKNPINVAMMGDLESIDPDKPAFNAKQQNYLAYLLAHQAAINDVKELERKNQITLNENDRLESYLQHLDEKRVQVFERITIAMK